MQHSTKFISCIVCLGQVGTSDHFCSQCGTPQQFSDVTVSGRSCPLSKPSSLVRLDRLALLSFFDAKVVGSEGHATAVNAVAGEDLGAGLLKHYLERVHGAATIILDAKATQGTVNGVRLDFWMHVQWPERTVLYQVEVKNWSAHSFGGRRLKDNATADEVAAYKIHEWTRRIWDNDQGQFLPSTREKLNKVLVEMLPPLKGCPVEPVACMWAPMHPHGEIEPWFSVELPADLPFTTLRVFSMSSYLRTLQQPYLTIEMPQTVRRLDWFAHLFQPIE